MTVQFTVVYIDNTATLWLTALFYRDLLIYFYILQYKYY